MKKLCVTATCFAVLVMLGVAHSQQVDAAFGLSGITSPPTVGSSGEHFPQIVGGGAFPTVSADLLFKRSLGVQGEVSWRASQNTYFGFQPFRPIFYDFNAIWAPPLGSRANLEVLAGLGAENVRFYQPSFTCSFTTCNNYDSSNHLLGDVGAGLRLYVTKHLFVRPEVRQYFVRNNFEFTSPYATRVGASIGYSFSSE